MKNVGNTSAGRSQGVPKISGRPCIGRMGALRGHLCDSTAFLSKVFVYKHIFQIQYLYNFNHLQRRRHAQEERPEKLDVAHTPCGHEDGHGDCGVVVKDSGKSGEVATITEVSVVTQSVALGTCHEQRSGCVADVIPIQQNTTALAAYRLSLKTNRRRISVMQIAESCLGHVLRKSNQYRFRPNF